MGEPASFKEIGEHFNVPAATASLWYRQALAKVAGQLSENMALQLAMLELLQDEPSPDRPVELPLP